jgi:hypothetical protein
MIGVRAPRNSYYQFPLELTLGFLPQPLEQQRYHQELGGNLTW